MSGTAHHQLSQRLDKVESELKSIRAIVNNRRDKAGKQLDSDHDHSAYWLGKDLKQLMAPLLRNGTWKP